MYLIILIVLFSTFVLRRRLKSVRKKVVVVVLGDIGRSPRMQYHALSLAGHSYDVHLLGYGGSKPHEDILKQENIRVHEMIEVPGMLSKFPKLLIYISKVAWQSCMLLFHLIYIGKSSHILLQNPPCIPAMAVACLVSLWEGSCLVVDWHNYGYTILGLALGHQHPLVKFAKWYEKFFGRLSKYNLCVTKAMKTDLHSNWNIVATTMYDRPPEIFKTASIDEQHRLFGKLSKKYDIFKSKNFKEDETVFTNALSENGVEKLRDRPALIVSGTSWTEDEDFSLLLDSLREYEKIKSSGSQIPSLICVITGKGPLKNYYIEKISNMTWKYVQFCTPWLEPEDYPILLGSADLGVCLHTSSSGLDLPMKVVDMFGCGLPVCAIAFKCLPELVKDNENGQIFNSSSELTSQFKELLSGFPDICSALNRYRSNLKSFQKTRWKESWNEHVLPLFE